LESDILATQKSLASKKRDLENAKNGSRLNSRAIIEIQLEVEALEDGLKRLNALKAELF
jgi:hypothetical protein